MKPAQPFRVGFMNIDGVYWTGGRHYLLNLFLALRCLDNDARPQIVLLVENETTIEELGELYPLVDEVLHLPSLSFWRRQRTRIGKRLRLESALSVFLRRHSIHALFSNADLGQKLRLPLLSWVPDFQHVHLKEMFPVQEIGRRNAVYRRMGSNATSIIASSAAVKTDWIPFSPEVSSKVRVLNFVAQIPADVYSVDCRYVCEKYHLPERFIFLPNQFWKHKNHMLVVDALALSKTSGSNLTVVCTGNTNDYRDASYFGNLLAKISQSDVRDNLILLGLVPHSDLFQLIRQSIAVMQPSLSEGWSTTVEEVKSVGKRIILSDIAVHREQDPPAADYFDPHCSKTLASMLVHVFDTYQPGPDLELETRAKNALPQRTREFAETFRLIAREAAALK